MRRKVPSSGHRLLHKVGRSKATNINNRETHGKGFLQLGKLLDDLQKARKLRVKASLYKLMDGTLYQRSYFSPWLSTNGTRRRKVPSSGHRLLHKVGRSKATNINNREAYGKVRVGIHSMQV
uniref:Uncharacterized protein n=1 Tax=Tanacetum cinerariifolium TaxID=118510 RepID=A0A699KKJ8_TANCI|nr:hypothetical protein [Tanacetum cinerariifolium]